MGCASHFLGPGDFRFELKDDTFFLGYRKHTNRSQNRHFHKGYEILLVLSGERQMFAENRTYLMKRRDLLLIPPETLHKSLSSRTGSEIFTLVYNPESSLTELLGKVLRRFTLPENLFESFRKRFEKISREFREKSPGYETAIRAAGDDLFVQLLRIPENGKDSDRSERSEVNQKMMAVAEYIHVHCSSNLNLSDLSEKYFISPSYLSRSFHRETGFSLVEYINNTRIMKAKTELLTTEDSVSLISERCGFGSVTNFGRIFKSITGVSPRTYRLRGGLVPE